MKGGGESHRWRIWEGGVLGLAWLAIVVCDRVWLAIDHHVPDWDEADYLTGALNYGRAIGSLLGGDWGDRVTGEWWTSLWLLSSKIPPLVYIVAGGMTHWIGRSADAALWVNAIAALVLLTATYGLGRCLFDNVDRGESEPQSHPQQFGIGFWAALLVLVLPGVLTVRRIFVLDYAVCAAVAAIWWGLTRWRRSGDGWRDRDGWLWAIAVGLIGGLGLMVKQTVVLFTIVPVLWIVIGALWQRRWARVVQTIAALWVSSWVWGGWYGTNWLLILTSGKRATVDSAIAEGDPSVWSWRAWTYYLDDLPDRAYPWLLGLAIGGGLLTVWRSKFAASQISGNPASHPFKAQTRSDSDRWLLVISIGAYVLGALSPNKDPRYILPEVAILAIWLALGLSVWSWKLRMIAIALAFTANIAQTWPTSDPQASPDRAYAGANYPHAAIVAAVCVRWNRLHGRRSACMPSTKTVNQHNLNFYGAIADFAIYGRQVGTIAEQVPADIRALSWFLVKTGDPGSVPESYAAMVEQIRHGGEFERFGRWDLPDGEMIEVYRKIERSVEIAATVQPGSPALPASISGIALALDLPKQAIPGSIVPVTYRWTGNWEALRDRVMLLGWHNSKSTTAERPAWIHDRAVTAGNLTLKPLADGDPHSCRSRPANCTFEIIDRTAMQIPAEIAPGRYQLQARSLDPRDRDPQAVTLQASDTMIEIVASSSNPSNPSNFSNSLTTADPRSRELDLSQQLRQLAALMPQGLDQLDHIFSDISRINQYDPTQDYLDQTIAALEFRLQIDPRLDWAYTIAIAQLLKKRIDPAIAAFDRITQLDPANPYGWAYLAVVETIGLHPHAAYRSIDRAIAIAPTIPEFHTLRGVLAILYGNLSQARQDLAPSP
ncbi:MAG: phospholipid carrier-dependent glycosyltransferase [Coleofasciculaceae cyanobacterium RL_1_1]|nr:phospholipid carrier-dependent glycosyltransferase [Coleofasciculaceae cyanobacterium RL_1_1]